MENIFENAYFGKTYKTRDGRKAIYWRKLDFHHRLICEDLHCSIITHNDGRIQADENNKVDIISEYQEKINEEELNKVLDKAEKMREFAIGRKETGGWYWRKWAEWGYRKAWEFFNK